MPSNSQLYRHRNHHLTLSLLLRIILYDKRLLTFSTATIILWSSKPDFTAQTKMNNHEEELILQNDNTADIDMADSPTENEETQLIAENDVDMSENNTLGDGDSNETTTISESDENPNFDWQMIEEDVEQFRRAYGRNLNRIAVTEVLKHALIDVESLQNRVQTEAQRIYGLSTIPGRRRIQQRRPELLITLRKIRDSLLVALSKRPSVNAQGSQEVAAVKLPKLEIRNFDGKATDWLDFKTQYQSSIHQSSLSEGLKFRYLRSLVNGEPLHYIRHLPATDGNYNRAWSILCAHYDNPLNLLQLHTDELINCQPMKRDGKSCTLRELYAYFKQHIAGIRTIERENPQLDATSTAYIHLFLNKCASNIRTEFRKEVLRNPAIGTTEEGFWSFVQGLVHAEVEPEKEKPSKRGIAFALPLASGEETTKFAVHRSNRFPSTRDLHLHAAYACAAIVSEKNALRTVRKCVAPHATVAITHYSITTIYSRQNLQKTKVRQQTRI